MKNNHKALRQELNATEDFAIDMSQRFIVFLASEKDNIVPLLLGVN